MKPLKITIASLDTTTINTWFAGYVVLERALTAYAKELGVEVPEDPYGHEATMAQLEKALKPTD